MWQPSPETLFGRGDELLGDLLAARRAADEEAEVDAPADLVAHQLVEAAREARKTVVLKMQILGVSCCNLKQSSIYMTSAAQINEVKGCVRAALVHATSLHDKSVPARLTAHSISALSVSPGNENIQVSLTDGVRIGRCRNGTMLVKQS